MINEEELIAALENIGFNAVTPSKMTYEEQVETFSNRSFLLPTTANALKSFGTCAGMRPTRSHVI
jgi:capsular polysaccharide biosynthesis protein